MPNFAYVRIKNRGTAPIAAIDVRGYHSKPMTGLIWPADWAPMTTPLITVPRDLRERRHHAGGRRLRVDADDGRPRVPADDRGTPGDRSVVDSVGGTVSGSIPHWRLVPHDNNIAQRNVAPVSGMNRASLIESLSKRWFEIVNPSKRKKAVVFVDLKLPPLLVKLGWHVKLKGVKAERFTLAAGQKVEGPARSRSRRSDLAQADQRAEKASADRRHGLDRRRGRRRDDLPDRPEVEVTGDVPGPGPSGPGPGEVLCLHLPEEDADVALRDRADERALPPVPLRAVTDADTLDHDLEGRADVAEVHARLHASRQLRVGDRRP